MDENISNQVNSPYKGTLKEQLTTVTPFSKYLAFILFITLPLVFLWIGFELGQGEKNYSSGQQTEVVTSDKNATPQVVPASTSTDASDHSSQEKISSSTDVGSWNVLRSEEYAFEVKYPPNYILSDEWFTGEKFPGKWKIYENIELPPGYAPMTVSLEVIDPREEIRINHLDGSYTKYDPDRGQCYRIFGYDNDQERNYMTQKINGYSICENSVGDAGSTGHSVYFIYPDKVRALRIATGGDEFQKPAPLSDFVETVRLFNY